MSKSVRIELISGAAGIYQAQEFAEDWNHKAETDGVSGYQWQVLLDGPNAEGYWETYSNVLANFRYTDPDGNTLTLYQDEGGGNLWLIDKDQLDEDGNWKEFDK